MPGDRKAGARRAGRQQPRIENYLGFPAGLSGMDLTRRAVTQARRFGAEIISTQFVTSIRLQDMYRVITPLQRHGDREQSGADRDRRSLPQAGCAGHRRVHRRRRLLRRGLHRGGLLQGPACARGGRRQLGGTGRAVPQPLRQQGDDADSPLHAGGHVAVSARRGGRQPKDRTASSMRRSSSCTGSPASSKRS